MLVSKMIKMGKMCQIKGRKDWQYIAEINRHLKQSDHNSALRSLINSNLSKIVLDVQTFKNMHEKMVELNVSISYNEVVYKLYRETFKPNHLMLDAMNYLTSTKSSKIMQLLKKDYQTLQLQIPSVEKKQKQKPSQQKNSTQQKKINQYQISSKPNSIQLIEKQELEKKTKGQLQPEQIRRILQALLGSYSKVVVHDVELYCNNFDEDYNSEDEEGFEEQQNQQGDMNDDELLQTMASSISKIKIGKIEIFDKRDPQDPKNDNY